MTGLERQQPPEPLTYAPDGSRGVRAVIRRHKWWVASGLGLLIVMLVLAWGTDFGRGVFNCRICHARCSARWFYVLDMGGWYNVRITEGAVWRLIQARVSGPCTHDWEYAYGTRWISLVLGAREQGRGLRGFTRSGLLDDNAAQLLEERARADAGFVRRLKQALDDPDTPANEAWLNQLMDEAYARSESQPATAPGAG